MSKTSRILRLMIGFIILIFPLINGFWQRSPWLIPILGLVYTPLYVLGRSNAWLALKAQGAGKALLKSLLVIFITQLILVGIFYLIGFGLAARLTDNLVQEGLVFFDIIALIGFGSAMLLSTSIIAYIENPIRNVKASFADKSNSVADEGEGDFKVLSRRVTPETFFRGGHFNRADSTGTAITDKVDYQGDKIIRRPKQASEAMIAKAEKNLGFKLPETLRHIYKIQDGGCLPTYFVPKIDGAVPTYDDWLTAFAHDYDVLNPLRDLETLHDLHMENYEGEYSDPDEKDDWIPGCEKLVILAIRTGYGTALDYRKEGKPGVLLFDNNLAEAELKTFDSFDAFLAACREIDFDYGHRGVEDAVFGAPPDPNDPDNFWDAGNPGAGITHDVWADTGKTLGVTLPEELRPFYSASNGGISRFSVTLPM